MSSHSDIAIGNFSLKMLLILFLVACFFLSVVYLTVFTAIVIFSVLFSTDPREPTFYQYMTSGLRFLPAVPITVSAIGCFWFACRAAYIGLFGLPLHKRLRRLGHHWISAEDCATLFFALRTRAWRIPRYEEVAVLPGFEEDPMGCVIRIMREQRR